MHVETTKAAESVLEAFNGLKARVIVQEYIKEAKGAHIRAFVIGGQVVGALKQYALERDAKSNFVKKKKFELIQLNDEEEIAVLKAARAVSLGVAGVDMIQSSRGPLILEVNASPSLESIEKVTGKNIAGAIIKFIGQNADA